MKYNYGSLGIHSEFIPFPKLQFYLSSGINYVFSIGHKKNITSFNLGEKMYKSVSGQLIGTGIDLNSVSNYYNENCNIDIRIDKSYKQFYTGLRLRIGIGVRL